MSKTYRSEFQTKVKDKKDKLQKRIFKKKMRQLTFIIDYDSEEDSYDEIE